MAAAVGLLVVVALGGGGGAAAHSGDQSYVYIDLLSDRVEGRVEYLAADVNQFLGLGLVDDEAAAERQLEDSREVLEEFTRRHFDLDLGDGSQTVTFGDVEYLELSVGSYVVQHFSTGPLPGEPPRTFAVRYDAFLDEPGDRSALLLIGRDWENGILSNEAEHLRVFDEDDRAFTIELDEGSWMKGMRGTVELGIEHIRTGADHIMFILLLLLPAVLVFRDGRRYPAPGFASSLVRVLKVATAFTVAHSITLSLAALGVLSVDTKLVESIIAVSIVLAALHNLRPVFANREWLIAFSFGLFHGLGFAGLLQELGLGRDQKLWTLLGFNLGVELGQAAIILLLFPTLYLLRRTRLYEPMVALGSVALAVAALGWAVERVFELEPRIDSLFDPVLYYPRVLVLMAVAVVAAGVLYETDRRRARLVPFPDADG